MIYKKNHNYLICNFNTSSDYYQVKHQILSKLCKFLYDQFLWCSKVFQNGDRFRYYYYIILQLLLTEISVDTHSVYSSYSILTCIVTLYLFLLLKKIIQKNFFFTLWTFIIIFSSTNASQTARKIVYGKNAGSEGKVRRWFAKFKCENFSLENDEHFEQQLSVNKDLLKEVIAENPHYSVQELSHRLNFPKSTVHDHLRRLEM